MYFSSGLLSTFVSFFKIIIFYDLKCINFKKVDRLYFVISDLICFLCVNSEDNCTSFYLNLGVVFVNKA